MDNNIAKRIVGVLVVIALTVIALPLLLSNDENAPVKHAGAIVPPFPEVQQNVKPTPLSDNAPTEAMNTASNPVAAAPTEVATTVASTASVQPDAAMNPVAAPMPDNAATNEKAALTAQPATTKDNGNAILTLPKQTSEDEPVVDPNAVVVIGADGEVIEQNDAQLAKIKPEVISTTTPENTVSPSAATATQAATTATPSAAKQATASTPAAASVMQTPTTTTTSQAKSPLKTLHDDLTQLKKTAWVVQMGSFKNHDNATRLTNALRAKGYKAFTYETKTNGQVRVYVGPEFKPVAANQLISKIEHDTHMRGVLVSYKPLEL